VSNTTKLILGIVAAVAVVAVGLVAFSVLRPPAQATAPIQAIPLTTAAPTVAAAPAATEAPATAAPPTEAPATAAAPTEAPATAAAAPAAETIFRIVPEESEVRFIIDEVLNNNPVTVVGATNQVAGEIAVNTADPSQSRVGTIQVNARTLATDNDFRNRAIANRILTTDQYEFITFEPTALSGLPASGAIGESYSFQMTGNLTIRDVTREVTFDVTVTPSAPGRLEGTAVSTVRYPDFGLAIPSVPQVASVEEDVRLELQFVAAAG
jgi:polyisoprenoid-binding protein YceI